MMTGKQRAIASAYQDLHSARIHLLSARKNYSQFAKLDTPLQSGFRKTKSALLELRKSVYDKCQDALLS